MDQHKNAYEEENQQEEEIDEKINSFKSNLENFESTLKSTLVNIDFNNTNADILIVCFFYNYFKLI